MGDGVDEDEGPQDDRDGVAEASAETVIEPAGVPGRLTLLLPIRRDTLR